MSTVYVLLTIAGLGIGGILVPASIITTIVCPDDLIATVTALTLAIRVVGGSIGYAIFLLSPLMFASANQALPLTSLQVCCLLQRILQQIRPYPHREG